MEALTKEIAEIIDGHQKMRMCQQANALKSQEKDEYGYPFEPSDSFGTTPLSFTETAMRLQVEAAETFRLLREINRHSPLFYQMSAQLEKLLSQLGSACITKTIMEQQEGEPFLILKDITIDWLREKTAFNFRKCYASFMESQGSLRYNQQALSLSIRWAALDKRLIATAEKIEKIKSGKLKIELKSKEETLQDQTDEVSHREQNTDKQSETTKSDVNAFAPKAHALPIDKSFTANTASSLNDSTNNAYTNSITADITEKVSTASESISPESETGCTASEIVSSEPEQQPENDTSEPAIRAEIADLVPVENTDESDLVRPEEMDFDDEEDYLPYISEELVRKMYEYYHGNQAAACPFPVYETASDPP